jgi:hypothetical protein
MSFVKSIPDVVCPADVDADEGHVVGVLRKAMGEVPADVLQPGTPFKESLIWPGSFLHFFLKATTLYPGGIRPHDPYLA